MLPFLPTNTMKTSPSVSSNSSSIVFTMEDFDDLVYVAIDQSFSFFFMLLFIVLILLIIGFSIKSDWKTLKKSQKNIILMILTLLTTQMIGLSGRTCYNFIDLSILTRYQDYLTEKGYTENDQLYIDVVVNGNDTTLTTDMVGIPYGDVVGLFLSKSIEAFFILLGLVIINMVLHYISHLFFNLIKYSQGVLKSNRTRVIRKIFDVVMFVTYMCYLVLLTAIFVLLLIENLKIIHNIQLIFFIISFVLFVFQLISQTVFSLIVATTVLSIINQARKKFKDQSNQYSWKQPIVKIVILQAIMIISMFIQIVAIGFGVVISVWNNSALIYDFLNNLGILIFSILVLCLYHPAFDFFKNENESNNKENASNRT